MNQSQKVRFVAIAAGLSVGLALAVQAHAGKPPPKRPSTSGPVRLLKCIDDRGKVFYSDRPGPQCAQGDILELNRQGVVVNRPGQKAGNSAVTASKKETAAQRQDRVEQERRDKALLMTYTSEEQIEESKKRSLEIPTLAIKQTEAKLAKAQKALDDTKRQSETYTSANKPVPPTLRDDLHSQEKAVARLEENLADRKDLAAEIGKRFDSEKARFRELTAAAGR